jgi:hypothetical protein
MVASASLAPPLGPSVTTRPAKRLLSHGWLYVPAVSSPVGGGLIKIGHGSTWAAVVVGAAPYAICAMLYVVFVIGYLAALIRYMCAEPGGQEAMERLIAVSANAIVSILTLTVTKLPPQAKQPPAQPHPDAEKCLESSDCRCSAKGEAARVSDRNARI